MFPSTGLQRHIAYNTLERYVPEVRDDKQLRPYIPAIRKHLAEEGIITVSDKETPPEKLLNQKLTLDQAADYFFDKTNIKDLPGRMQDFIRRMADCNHDGEVSVREIAELDHHIDSHPVAQMQKSNLWPKDKAGDGQVTLAEFIGVLAWSYRQYLGDLMRVTNQSQSWLEEGLNRLRSGQFTFSTRSKAGLFDLSATNTSVLGVVYKSMLAARYLDLMANILPSAPMAEKAQSLSLQWFAKDGVMPFLNRYLPSTGEASLARWVVKEKTSPPEKQNGFEHHYEIERQEIQFKEESEADFSRPVVSETESIDLGQTWEQLSPMENTSPLNFPVFQETQKALTKLLEDKLFREEALRIRDQILPALESGADFQQLLMPAFFLISMALKLNNPTPQFIVNEIQEGRFPGINLDKTPYPFEMTFAGHHFGSYNRAAQRVSLFLNGFREWKKEAEEQRTSHYNQSHYPIAGILTYISLASIAEELLHFQQDQLIRKVNHEKFNLMGSAKYSPEFIKRIERYEQEHEQYTQGMEQFLLTGKVTSYSQQFVEKDIDEIKNPFCNNLWQMLLPDAPPREAGKL